MDLVGKTIADRYEIIENVGRGGMANVYKSKDKLLDRFVAVKVLREDLKNDKEFVRRFNTEAKAAASLSNPHIVSIFDVGCENGLYYIVMEFVEGDTLKEYIDGGGAIPWREAVGYAKQICDGIAEAHKNSVIHRDIKPQNIIMTPDKTLKITDFGIARATSQATMTMAGNNTIGTAHYLSPEQARGGYIDQRTDIYSLGIVMYEMLTGQLPFNDESPVAIAIKHLQESAKHITEIKSDIPKPLEAIVEKAMAKEPDNRYASAQELLKDLDIVLKNPNARLSFMAADTAAAAQDSTETIALPKLGEDVGETRAISDDNVRENGKSSSKRKRNSGAKKDPDPRSEEDESLKKIRDKRAKREKKRKERKIGFIAFLLGLAVLATGIGVAYSVTDGFGLFGRSHSGVEIPNLVDMTIDEARDEYGSQGYSIIESGRTESTKPVGTILEQNPEAGTRSAAEDIVIRVTVSSGSSSVTLDDYSGMDYEEAREQIEMLGLRVNRLERSDDEVEAGKVIEQNPEAGSSVSSGETITLYVSRGRQATPEPISDSGSGGSSGDSQPSSGSGSSSGSSSSESGSSSDDSSDDEDTSSGSSSSGSGSSSGSSSSGESSGSGSSGSSGGSSSGSSSSGSSSSGSSSSGGSSESGGSSSGSSSSGSGSSGSSSGSSSSGGSSESGGSSGSSGGSSSGGSSSSGGGSSSGGVEARE